jgi:hypothetical protein
MKHPLPLLFVLLMMAVLLGVGNKMNSACKTSAHSWCAPVPQARHVTTRSQEHDSLADRVASHVRVSSQ